MGNAGQTNAEPDSAADTGPRPSDSPTLRGSVRPRLMLVDDDRELIDLLIYSLHRAGMDVAAVLEASSVLRQFDALRPDLVLLEIMLGGYADFGLLSSLRRRSEVPIIILTVLRSEDDTVRALELGADDYLTKPFSPVELTARIRAQLRLAGWPAPQPHPDHLAAGSITLDMAEHRLIRHGHSVALTPMEFRLLAALMANAGNVLSADALVDVLWERRDENSRATLHVLVHRLRRKLEDDPAHPTLLQTVAGVGFRFAQAEAQNQ
jgi:two-component system, OmpR family, response regulator MtrA